MSRVGNQRRNVSKIKKDIKILKKDEKKIMKGKRPLRRRRIRALEGLRKGVTNVTAPLAKGYNDRFMRPKMASKKDSITVTHSEYLGNLIASDGLTQMQYRINPTDEHTFPWLSTFANAYEKYKIKRASVRYVANCSSTVYGKVFMYFDYDPNDNPNQDLKVILNTMDAVSGSPWVNKRLPFRKSFDAPKQFLIRSPYQSYTDYILYDPANLYVGTIGTLAGDLDTTQDLGEIWIDYEVELSVPDPSNEIPLYNCVLSFSSCNSIQASDSNYYPSLSTATGINYVAGNYLPTYSTTGFVFPTQFVGWLTLRLSVSNGFDSARIPSLNNAGGASNFLKFYCLDDETFSGDDVWMSSYQVFCPAGSALNFANGLTTSSVVYNYIGVSFYSCNPKWWEYPAPSILAEIATGKTKKTVDLKKKRKKAEKDNVKRFFELLGGLSLHCDDDEIHSYSEDYASNNDKKDVEDF